MPSFSRQKFPSTLFTGIVAALVACAAETEQGCSSNPREDAASTADPLTCPVGKCCPPTPCGKPYTVTGTVSGLTGTGLTLNVTTGTTNFNLNVSQNGSLSFNVLNSGWGVVVATQPTNQACTVQNGVGTGPGHFTVVCGQAFTVGGTIAGLESGTTSSNALSLLLWASNLSSAPQVELNNGAYTLSTPVATGQAYQVVVDTQPPGQYCSVANATGTIGTANVSNANVTCETCGAGGQACCPAGAVSACNTGYECHSGTCVTPCGDEGQSCCQLAPACNSSGDTCSNGMCKACGGTGQPCCEGSCSTGNVCAANGMCEQCGNLNEPCCAGSCYAGAGTCKANICTTATQLTFVNSKGTTDFGTNVPTNGTYAYAGWDGELGSATENDTLTFTPGSFPTGQQVVVYEYGYGFGSTDIGSASTPSDVLSGHFPCVDTHYVSVGAPSPQSASSALSSLISTGQVVRYVDGTCRVSVPYLPVFRDFVAQVPALIKQRVPSWLTTKEFQFVQPQFLSDGSNLEMGITYEALLNASIAGVNATASFDPALSANVRTSDGLFQLSILADNFTLTNFETGAIHDQVHDALTSEIQSIQDQVNSAVSPSVSQLLSVLGLSGVTTTCTTPTPAAPSAECFNNINSAITSALTGAPTQIVQLASQILQPINFTCKAGTNGSANQCLFHPVIQALNFLPDRVEIVVAPDLRNPTDPINDVLTQFFKLVGPVGLTQSVTFNSPAGVVSVPITVDCSLPPVTTKTGAITTVFEGDSSLAAGIQCGSIAQQ